MFKVLHLNTPLPDLDPMTVLGSRAKGQQSCSHVNKHASIKIHNVQFEQGEYERYMRMANLTSNVQVEDKQKDKNNIHLTIKH